MSGAGNQQGSSSSSPSRLFLPSNFIGSFTAMLEDDSTPLPHSPTKTGRTPRCSISATSVDDDLVLLQPQPKGETIGEYDDEDEPPLDEAAMRHLTDQILANEDCFNAYVTNAISFDEMLQQVCHSAALEEAEAQQQLPPPLAIAPTKPSSGVGDDSSVDGANAIFALASKSLPGRQKTKAAPRARRTAIRLPPELSRMLGQAEMCLVEDKVEEAKNLCLKIIQLAPLSYEAYYVLADIFLRQGDAARHRNFLRVSATLDQRDAEKLRQLLEIAERENDVNDCIHVCRKLINVEPMNVALRQKLIGLLEQNQQEKLALMAKLRMYELITMPNEAAAVQAIRELSQRFCQLSDLSHGSEAYDVIFVTYRHLATEADENDAVDLMLHNKEFKRAIQFLAKYCGVTFMSEDGVTVYDGNGPLEEWNGTIVRCTFPPKKASDIIARTLIALLWEGLTVAAEEHISYLLERCDLEVCGDWFYEMAEACMALNLPEKAIVLLELLTQTQNYSQELVWLLLAKCRARAGFYERAVVAYEQVLRLAPLNGDVVLQLVELHRAHGNEGLALETLQQSVAGEESPAMDPRPGLRCCGMLAVQGRWDEYVQVAWRLLFGIWCRAILPAALWNDLQTRQDTHHYFNRLDRLLRQNETPAMRQLEQEYERTLQRCQVTRHHLWEVLLTLVTHLREEGPSRLHKLESTLALAYCLPMRFPSNVHDEGAEWHRRVKAMFCFTALRLQHFSIAYKIISPICLKMPHSNAAWNLFNITLTTRTRTRYDRLVNREAKRKQNNLSILILNAHNSLCSSSYRAAIGAYVALAEELPQDPLFPLCSAVCWLAIAGQKLVVDRHSALAQGIGFITRYTQLRGPCAETNYNAGRFFHHVGLNHVAIPYYQRAIHHRPDHFSEEADNQDVDLSKEAAFNLMLMYKKNGNKRMAAYIMQEYLVI